MIHNRAGVSPEVRESVERILREMDYAPNAAAVALKSAGRKMTVGVIVPDLSNEFYYEVYDGIQDAVKRFRAYGITTMEYKMPTSTEEALLLAIDTLMEQKVDALALQAMDAPAIEKRMAQLPPDFPVVTFNSDFSHGKRMCFVGQDSFAAGRVAGKMLGLRIPEKGKVAIFIGRAELVHQRERESGFRQAMAERGCTAELIGPFETKEDESRAYTMASQLIAQEPGLVGIYAAGGGQKHRSSPGGIRAGTGDRTGWSRSAAKDRGISATGRCGLHHCTGTVLSRLYAP